MLIGAVASIAASAPADARLVWTSDARCDEVVGVTLALNERWRIVKPVPRAGHERGVVLSCDRTRHGAAVVRRLAFSAGYGTYGGDVVGVRALVGDRALLSTENSASGGTSDQLDLIDLRRGGSAPLGSWIWDNTPSYSPLFAAFAANGSLATAQWTGSSYPGTGGLIRVLDGHDGAGPLQTPVCDLVPAQAGAYYRALDGRPGKLEIREPVPASALVADRSLRATRRALPRRPRTSQTTRTPLPSSTTWDLGFEIVRTTRGESRGTARVSITTRHGSREIASVQLAPDSWSELRVLARGPHSLAVAARFADAPGERRIRLLGERHADSPQFDIPSRPTAELPGNAVFLSRATDEFALADGDQLRVWGARSWTRTIPGVGDLAASRADRREPGVFYTDGAGQARYLALSELADADIAPQPAT